MRSRNNKFRRFFENIKSQIFPQNGLNFRRRRRKIQFDKIKYVSIFAIEIIAVLLLAFGVIEAFGMRSKMLGDSMSPTLEENQVVLRNSIIYHISDPQPNDIVVFLPSGNLNAQASIKRVVGVAGDKVQIMNGTLFINEQPFKEAGHFDSIKNAGLAANEIVLGEDQYFLLGDNRNNSEDSRYQTIGIVSKTDMIGKVWLSVSWGKFGLVN